MVRRKKERNRQKPVGRDEGSLTEQKTKGTVTTTIQKRGIHRSNQHNRARRTEPLSWMNRRCALPSRKSVPAVPPPPPEPSMTAHGMEYPALFGQAGLARPTLPLPGVL